MAGDILIHPDTLIATDQMMRHEDLIDPAHIAYLALSSKDLSDGARMVAEPMIFAASVLSYADPEGAARLLGITVNYCLRDLGRTKNVEESAPALDRNAMQQLIAAINKAI